MGIFFSIFPGVNSSHDTMNNTRTTVSALVVYKNRTGRFTPAFVSSDESGIFETGKKKPDATLVTVPGGIKRSLITRDTFSGITQLQKDNEIFKTWFMIY
jgi:hypothetical protein